MTNLERAFAVIEAKQDGIKKLWQYYDGDQPLVYSTRRLEETFRNLDARFNQNWCAVVIDSVLDRLGLSGFDVKNSQADQVLDNIFNRERLVTDCYDVHEAALVGSEAYVIAWKNEDGETEIYYNDPRIVHLFYKADNPKVKDFAAKMWQETDGTWKITLYYPDRLEYYTTTLKMKFGERPSKANAFQADEPDQADNLFGVVPVFHWRINRRRRKSELDNVISLQDAVNKLLADMMVAAEFGAFKQRYIISQGDTSNLKNSPGVIWEIPAAEADVQPTSVGEFQETNLDMYLNSIDKLVNSVAIITRTPKHYFMSTGANISGDALIALESPLIRKVKRFQELFGSTWIELAQFILQLEGMKIPVSDITATWERAESVQPTSEAQNRQLSKLAGIPLTTILKDEGWNAARIDAMKIDLAEESANAKTSLAQALIEAERKFNAGDENAV